MYNLTEAQAKRYYSAESEHVRSQTTFEQWVSLSDVTLTGA